MTAHEALRQARLQRHWTQEQLATQLNTTRMTVNRWERGNGIPGPYFRRLLFELFGEDFFHATAAANGSTESKRVPSVALAIWQVPFTRNLLFTGREDILRNLALSFRSTSNAALTQVQIISALGGMGKTQTALEYAYRFREDYTAVIWLRAETREHLFADVVDLVAALNLPEKQERDNRQIIKAVQRWLAEHMHWCIVFDNVEDLAVVREFLPAQFVGHVLITTQLHATGSFVHRLDLPSLPPEEGGLFLLRRAKLLSMQEGLQDVAEDIRNQAEHVRQSLGGLPLALDQAGAYLEETCCTLVGYLQRLHARQLPLLSRRGQECTMYPTPVTATILLALDRVAQRTPAALEILRFCAFLAADAIPEELLTEGNMQELGPVLHAVVRDGFGLDEAFEALNTTSLLTLNTQTRLLTIHRIVQTVIRERLDKESVCLWAMRAISAVNRAFPVNCRWRIENWIQGDRLLPHALILLEYAKTYIHQEEPAEKILMTDLLFKTACYYFVRGDAFQAEPLLQQCLHERSQILGPEHLAIAEVLINLGDLTREQGRLTEAEAHLRRALSISEQHLGPLHLDLFRILISLSQNAQNRGLSQEAENFAVRALTICEQVQGPEHEEIGEALGNLATIYYLQGRYEEAETFHLRAVQLEEQRRGPKDPRIASRLNNLATLYWEQGRYEEAEPLYLRALSLREQGWGLEHPITATALYNLGGLYREQGRYEEAESHYQRALQIWERTAGPEHPFVALGFHGFAQLRAAQGRDAEAEHMAQHALQIRQQMLDETHPDLAESLHVLADLYHKQGKDTEAEPLYLRALTIYEQTKGHTHPKTQVVRDAYLTLQSKRSLN